MINWVHTSAWLKWIFPQLVWAIPTLEKKIYLTFDDGPTPEITSLVLALLLQHKAKATFFCLGSRIELFPETIEEIKLAGHVIGNHGYQHRSGFFTPIKKYVENARKGAEISGSKLFRPPYGHITPWQIRKLKKDYRLILWTIMSMDFKQHLSAEQCLNNVLKHIKPGAIIVFHDTEKAKEKILQVLPALLKWLDINGYQTEGLDDNYK